RNWVFGNVAALSRWACRVPRLSNRAVRSTFVRWLNEELLGVDRRRVLPAIAEREFMRKMFEKVGEAAPSVPLQKKQVLVFPDTFTNYYEPDLGLAAVDLLRREGCLPLLGSLEKSWVPRWLQAELSWPSLLRCCGRPMISNGLLSQAVE